MDTIRDMRTIIEGMWRMPAWQGKTPIIGMAAILLIGLAIAPKIAVAAAVIIAGFLALETRKPHVKRRIAAERAQGHR